MIHSQLRSVADLLRNLILATAHVFVGDAMSRMFWDDYGWLVMIRSLGVIFIPKSYLFTPCE